MLKRLMTTLGLIGGTDAPDDREEYEIKVEWALNGQQFWDGPYGGDCGFYHWKWTITRTRDSAKMGSSYAISKRKAFKAARKKLADIHRRQRMSSKPPAVMKVKM